jgi:hypothetical protein
LEEDYYNYRYFFGEKNKTERDKMAQVLDRSQETPKVTEGSSMFEEASKFIQRNKDIQKKHHVRFGDEVLLHCKSHSPTVEPEKRCDRAY